MMLQADPLSTSITGDFILAGGPGVDDWLAAMPGFRTIHAGPGNPTLAMRGPVVTSRGTDGRHWAALADLVEGTLGDGAICSRAPSPRQRRWRGRFAQLVWDDAGGDIEAFTDHFGSVPIYWFQRGAHYAIASDLRLLLDAPGCRREPDLTAVYHYLNFAYVPAPLTICHDIKRVEPGSRLQLRDGRSTTHRYYLPEYSEDLTGTDGHLAGELRERIVASVQDYRPTGERGWGCFLSGGTDSSSIVGILAAQHPDTRVRTCSIGFAESGYDEMGYARLAATASGADAHFDDVDRARALHLLGTMATSFDQPFGNASAIPTLACAQLGQGVGLTTMIAGDGGDEIFGGNQRYAKDKVMDAFYRLPGPLKALGRAAGGAFRQADVFLLNRLRNFTERASLPNPDRFYSDDSFASNHYDELLTDGFRGQIGKDASLEFMRGVYAQGSDASELHRIMRLDLLMAIAQNDLVKVHGACKAHGITVRFPYLDPSLVDFTSRLATRHKLRGLDKRHLFKRAMAGILPREIIRKPKQGFGLPISVWLRHDPTMQSLIRDVLLDDRTRQRGWIRPAFVGQLLDRHIAGGWDHSAELWQLLLLELWMRRHMDGQ